MNYSQREEFLIAADSFDGLTYRQRRTLVLSMDQNNGDKYSAELIKTLGGGVYNKLRDCLGDADYRGGVLSRLEKKGIRCMTVGSANYPEQLAAIPVPPTVLYCKGNTGLLKDACFCVVGSRHTLPSVLAACRNVAAELTSRFTVVTGIADGADTAALTGAVKSGKVICVLPYGHDYAGRAGNAQLLQKVADTGLMISEYPPQTAPQRYLYAVRNRVMAGLSKGVLVVSAAKRSGALSTAGYAADYGREVFAFPYFPGVTSGEGCNGLIKNGAYLCENVLDIFSCFGLEYIAEKKEELTQDERTVLEFLKERGEAHIQAIADAAGKKPFQMTIVLSSLEIKGMIAKTGGNRYALIGQSARQ